MVKKENKKIKKNEALEWKNTALRLKADYQNREKEIAKEKTALRGLVEENLISDFLPVLDNLKKAIDGAEDSGWVKGVEYVIKQFEDLLLEKGIEKMDLVDTEFDPSLAEAVEQKGKGNNVIKVIVDGYKKGDRVVRPARVIVGE